MATAGTTVPLATPNLPPGSRLLYLVSQHANTPARPVVECCAGTNRENDVSDHRQPGSQRHREPAAECRPPVLRPGSEQPQPRGLQVPQGRRLGVGDLAG